MPKRIHSTELVPKDSSAKYIALRLRFVADGDSSQRVTITTVFSSALHLSPLSATSVIKTMSMLQLAMKPFVYMALVPTASL